MELNTVNTIETSSICDNSCPYCPYPEQHKHRKTGFMTMETFNAALEFVRFCVKKGTQQELNLFGVGEPTLNPLLPEMIRTARGVLPLSKAVHINTNGNTMTRELALKLKEAGLTACDVTIHPTISEAKLRRVTETLRIFKKVGMSGQISMDGVLQPNNWAGQVDWFEPDYEYACPWLHKGQITIQSDGGITPCCFDAFAQGVIGSVFVSRPDQLDIKEFNLCKTCHQKPPRSIVCG